MDYSSADFVVAHTNRPRARLRLHHYKTRMTGMTAAQKRTLLIRKRLLCVYFAQKYR